MLADHPTWPVKKREPTLEEAADYLGSLPVVTPQPTNPQGTQGQGIPTPPPFPPQPTNQGTQAQQALVGKPCPFCGGPMTCQYVNPSSVSGFGNVAAHQPAQLEIGCHDTRCLGPKLQCLSGNMATAIQLWNTRSP